MCIRDSVKTGQTSLKIQSYVDTGVWVDAGRDGWRIFEGGTGSTLPMLYCECYGLFTQLLKKIVWEPQYKLTAVADSEIYACMLSRAH